MTTTRQRTRAIVHVHSHLSDQVIKLSKDAIRINTSKSVKQAGKFQITLVPRKNYLNLIFPNDLVNIYFDTGTGNGFVRTMFGYVDRIAESSQTDPQTGATSTVYNLTGSDYLKAVEKTDIYFNPSLNHRVDPRYSALNIEGSALRTSGFRSSGSPADMVENYLQVFLGFGNQWQIPTSYPTKFIKAFRERRRQRVRARIPSNLVALLKTFGIDSIDDANTALDDLIAKTKANLGLQGITQDDFNQLQANALSGSAVGAAGGTTYPGTYASLLSAQLAASQEQLSSILQGAATLQSYRDILTTTNSPVNSVVDLIDFSFIEALTVDGFVSNSTVWQSAGGVAQFIYGHCNEIVNELLVDLRPVTNNPGTETITSAAGLGPYSLDEDELGINVHGDPEDGFPANATAIQYVPAVVLREYPYSVVAGFDLSKYGLALDGNTAKVGKLGFGPVFSLNPNVAGRHIYNYQEDGFNPLIAEACLFEDLGQPIKHIDVVVVESSDIISYDLGRSDEDVNNLFALSATNFGAMSLMYKYVLNEFSPIMNDISIARNGLRTREPTTEFANYPRDQLCTGASANAIAAAANAVTQAASLLKANANAASGQPQTDLAGAVDSVATRRNLVRWQLLMDHWYQHNVEYLNGGMELRSMPELRVGYRLDWVQRHMSFYVDSVNQSWEYPGTLKTSIGVSRGQRNDPFPAYIPPVFSAESETRNNEFVQHSGDRSPTGRLSQFFQILDARATLHAVGGTSSGAPTDGNLIDTPPNADHNGRAEYSNSPISAEKVISDTVDIDESAVLSEDN